jgi:release factor glutamine methyltransferase
MPRTLGVALGKSSAALATAGIESPWREARLLAAHVLKQSYAWVFSHPEFELTVEVEHLLDELVSRRCQKEPLAKIIEHKEFWGLPFKTTRDTLDPRPDTETLIEAMLADHPDHSQPYRILDLGTGTGCLLLAALSELTNATGVGIDKSEAALAIAQENAERLALSNRANFLLSNWTEKINEKFDIVLTNPPYIDESTPLPPEVRLFDPQEALFAKKSGLADYESLAICLKNVLNFKGLVYVELGIKQAEDVVKIFESQNYILMGIKKDYGGVARCATFAYQICI